MAKETPLAQFIRDRGVNYQQIAMAAGVSYSTVRNAAAGYGPIAGKFRELMTEIAPDVLAKHEAYCQIAAKQYRRALEQAA